jgi:hypothetical protein
VSEFLTTAGLPSRFAGSARTSSVNAPISFQVASSGALGPSTYSISGGPSAGVSLSSYTTNTSTFFSTEGLGMKLWNMFPRSTSGAACLQQQNPGYAY